MLGGEMLIEVFNPVFEEKDVHWAGRRATARELLAASFNNTGKKGYEVLRELLTHPDWTVRRAAALGIGFAMRKTANQETIEDLQQALERALRERKGGYDAFVINVEEALGLILQGRSDAIEIFKPYLETEDYDLAGGAIYGLSHAYRKTCDEEALSTLKKLIKESRRRFRDWWKWEEIIHHALMGIGLVCQGSQDYALLRIFKPYLKRVGDDPLLLAATYASALVFEGTGNEYVLSLFKPLFWNLPEMKTVAAVSTYILFKDYGEEAISKLSRLIKYKIWGAYVTAAFGLGSALRGTGNQEAVEIIKRFLRSRSENARGLSGLALGDLYHKLGDEVYDELLEMAQNGKNEERGWAIYTMGMAYESTGREDILETIKSFRNPDSYDWFYGNPTNYAVCVAIGKLFKGSKNLKLVKREFGVPWETHYPIREFHIFGVADILADDMPYEYWRAVFYVNNQFEDVFYGDHIPLFLPEP